jgi:glycosyltransferase involved in cell wall biosynthesis
MRIGGDAMITDALRFARWLRRERPDAVLLTTFSKLVLASWGARLGGVPRVFYRVVLSSDLPHNTLDRLACRRFLDGVVLNAAAMRAPFLAASPRLDPARVHVVHDGAEPPRAALPAGALRAALGIPESAPVIGSVTRFAHQKRLDRLLGAFARLPGDAHCVLAGEGTELQAMKAWVDVAGLGPRVHFLGFREDVGDVLAALDVFVVSSDREGLAGAMLEAMAAGVPVVSTDVSGAGEALAIGSDDPAGVTVGFDEGELAAACASLLGDPALSARLASAGRRRALEAFSHQAMVLAYERLLGGTAGDARAGAPAAAGPGGGSGMPPGPGEQGVPAGTGRVPS